METCRRCAHADKVLHPCGTAQLTSAGTCTADTASLLTGTNLFHLNANMESCCQVLDELTEVHTFVSDIVEDGLVAVTLVLYVANLHLQSQILGNLTALNHRGVLAALGLAILVHIHRTGYTIYTLDVVGTLQVCFLDLQFHQSSCQRYHTDVMTRISLHSHNVTLLQV